MNWEAIGAIGEIVGAIAVVATLGYLATQIRQNTRSDRAASRQMILDVLYGGAWDTARDAELRKTTLSGLNRYSDLPADQKAAFHLLQLRYMGNLYNALLLRDAGSLDEESFNVIANAFVAGLLTPGGSDWWKMATQGSEIPPSVRTYVNERLSTSTELQSWTDVHQEWKQI